MNGLTLMFSWAGQSRSAAVVLAYVMKHLDMTLTEAEELVRCQHPAIRYWRETEILFCRFI